MIDVSNIFLPHPNPPRYIGEPLRWAGNARLVRAASPLLPKGEASAKGEACGVREPDFLVSPQYIGGIKGGNNSIKITTYHFSNNL